MLLKQLRYWLFLRQNLLDNKQTHLFYTGDLPTYFDAEIVKNIYGYHFELKQVTAINTIPAVTGSSVLITTEEHFGSISNPSTVDFYISLHGDLGSVLVINRAENENYIATIQRVRRRETVAMTPADSLLAIQSIVKQKATASTKSNVEADKKAVLEIIQEITNTNIKPLVASSGLSVQYAILMGLIHDAVEKHPEKAIKIIVQPNCYGGRTIKQDELLNVLLMWKLLTYWWMVTMTWFKVSTPFLLKLQ